MVAVTGEVDADNRAVLGEQLRSAPGDRLVIDASALSFIDSSGLSELLEVLEERQARGGEVVVRDPSPPVRRVFEIAGLTDVFQID